MKVKDLKPGDKVYFTQSKSKKCLGTFFSYLAKYSAEVIKVSSAYEFSEIDETTSSFNAVNNPDYKFVVVNYHEKNDGFEDNIASTIRSGKYKAFHLLYVGHNDSDELHMMTGQTLEGLTLETVCNDEDDQNVAYLDANNKKLVDKIQQNYENNELLILSTIRELNGTLNQLKVRTEMIINC